MIRLLDASRPVAQASAAWTNGALPLLVSAHLGPVSLPNELVTSVRCIVRVEDQLVLCETSDPSWHAWPGGRRQSGESYEDTAFREVHEETGWLLDRLSIKVIGWLHIELLASPPEDYPYPHPDLCQLVVVANATEFDDSRGVPWIDTDGHVLGSRLATPREVVELAVGFDQVIAPFLDQIGEG
jgi:8-oxo-dGTP pyrophosphatase MutT (NUDIX family)